ncbi:DUF547 domain-containing protein [Neotamlana laminarinivorans]|uniref:DUF547 domain-containing protein n=1 Tax=Neotamlana laminarinivorans TaxID=2883124 RepID=A0A9X1HZR4_9FLAO|nr:DUF547 domain-containing protein [Tamlana laminarinivorans]MCB4799159.1 DUF547 domain-containing protein [Tamlana laminarinivorans]
MKQILKFLFIAIIACSISTTYAQDLPQDDAIKNNHNQWNSLLQNHVSEEGNVDYVAFKNNQQALLNYIEALKTTYKNTNALKNATRNETLAFWINAYNALTIDLILKNYPLQSIRDLKDPWDQSLWQFGDKWFNLNTIEHKILRKMNEPRIHFAIVCASISCPKLQNTAFTASNINEQLTEATESFLLDKTKNEISPNELKLSKIFKWFTKDFKGKGSNVIDFLNKYSEIEIEKNAKITYKDYNWNLNK